jgi:hypothetical protein
MYVFVRIYKYTHTHNIYIYIYIYIYIQTHTHTNTIHIDIYGYTYLSNKNQNIPSQGLNSFFTAVYSPWQRTLMQRLIAMGYVQLCGLNVQAAFLGRKPPVPAEWSNCHRAAMTKLLLSKYTCESC